MKPCHVVDIFVLLLSSRFGLCRLCKGALANLPSFFILQVLKVTSWRGEAGGIHTESVWVESFFGIFHRRKLTLTHAWQNHRTMTWWQRCPSPSPFWSSFVCFATSRTKKCAPRTHLFIILRTSEKPFVSFWYFWFPLRRCLSFWRGWIRMPGYVLFFSRLFAFFFFRVLDTLEKWKMYHFSSGLTSMSYVSVQRQKFRIPRSQLGMRWTVACTTEMVVHIMNTSVHYCRSK
jgi:hypothetical protein